MRLLVYALPIALSLGFVQVATSVIGAPTSSLAAYLAWWLAVSLAATGVVWLVFGLTRRLLPLGALFELSLVFPDEAPSRFSVALGTRTVASLEERARLLRDAGEAPTAQEASEILLGLVAALDDHDRVTAGHADRVRAYSAALGREIGLSDDEVDRLNWAALLHDIGKLDVRAEILNKTGPPNDEERESLQLHPLFGEALVAPLREWLGEWIDAVGHHHERWDGTGYPRGLAADEIPRAGRIVAIADAYDVITSARSYKKPSSASAARAELVRSAGTQFDPSLVRAFVTMSLGRMRLVVGPLAWLSHAPLLARLPLVQSAGASLGGVAAVTAVSAAIVAGPAGVGPTAVSLPRGAAPAHVQPAQNGPVPESVARHRAKATPRSRPRKPARAGNHAPEPRQRSAPAAPPDATPTPGEPVAPDSGDDVDTPQPTPPGPAPVPPEVPPEVPPVLPPVVPPVLPPVVPPVVPPVLPPVVPPEVPAVLPPVLPPVVPPALPPVLPPLLP